MENKTPNPKVSLKAKGNPLADVAAQLKILAGEVSAGGGTTTFRKELEKTGLYPLKPTNATVLQLNLGKMCNQTCGHCHVDAGPDRKEIMTRETMQHCLDALDKSGIATVDLTGGAPEMNPDFRWLVSEIRKRGRKVMVRCNLTIILANPKYADLPRFFAENEVEVVSSLPHFSASRTDAQRGEGVFEKSIAALKMLNEVGYGKPGTGLALHLVYNPSGAFLPGSQDSLQKEFKKSLGDKHGVVFNSLYAITNLPISRFLEYLERSGNYAAYMQKLAEAYNPEAAKNVMCRNTLSVGWDGLLYDCDFNQMLGLKISDRFAGHIKEYDENRLASREIIVSQHCFGCTAGAGSSCGGEVV